MPFLFWFVAFLVFVAMEAASLALTAVWFAGGALVAFFVAICGGSFRLQLIILTVISALLLACVRPFARKYVNQGTQKTNAGSLVGKLVQITEDVDNAKWTGKGTVEGMEWTVRSRDPESVFPAGMSARIVDIQGVKLIVTKPADDPPVPEHAKGSA